MRASAWRVPGWAIGMTVSALGLGLAGAVAERGVPAMVPSTPVIALVDIDRALKGLKERETLQNTLASREAQVKQRIDALTAEIELAEGMLPNLPSDQQAEQAVKINMLKFEREMRARVATEELGAEQAKLLRQLYVKIDDAAERLARQAGYTLVLATDESASIPEGADTQQVRQVSSLRRVLFADPAHDITDELITTLNNAYDAGVSR